MQGSMKNIGKEKKEESIDELNNDYVLRLSGDRLVDAGICALNKDPETRTRTDKGVLLRLTEEIDFFRGRFGRNHAAMLSKYSDDFRYDFHPAGSVVFSQGDVGDKFYLILRGRVKVLVLMKRQHLIANNGNQPNNHNHHNNNKHNQQINQDQTDQKQENHPHQHHRKNEDHKSIRQHIEVEENIEVKQLIAGQTFGELALIDDKPRAATIVCIEDTHFITFEKQSFISVLKHKETEKLKEEIRHVCSNYLLKDFSLNFLKNIYLLGAVCSFQRGEVLFDEGDASDKLYLIVEGEFKIVKTYEYEQEELKVNKLNANERTKRVVVLDIGVVSGPSPLGEEEFFLGGDREVQAICESKEGIVMCINKKDFFRRQSYDPSSLRIMLNRVKQKKDLRTQRLEELQEKHKNHEDIETKTCLQTYRKKFAEKQQQQSVAIVNAFPNPVVSLKTERSAKDNTIRQEKVQIISKDYQISRNVKTEPTENTQNSPFQQQEQSQQVTKKIVPNNALMSSRVQSSLSGQFTPMISIERLTPKNSKKFSQRHSNLLKESTPSSRVKSQFGDMSNTSKQNTQLATLLSPKSNIQKKTLQLKINSKLLEQQEKEGNEQKQQIGIEEMSFSMAAAAVAQSIDVPAAADIDSDKKKQVYEKSFYFKQLGRSKSKSQVLIPTDFSKNESNSQTTKANSNSKKKSTADKEISHGNILDQSSSAKLNWWERSINATARSTEITQHGSSFMAQFKSNSNGLLKSELPQTINTSEQIPIKTPYLKLDQSRNEQEESKHLSRTDSFAKKIEQSLKQSIYVETKTRGSILTGKCRKFILNTDSQTILDQAKAKSIKQNPFLYIDEYPLPKQVDTNMSDQDVDRLIQEKLISSITKKIPDQRRQSLQLISCSSFSTFEEKEELLNNQVKNYNLDSENKRSTLNHIPENEDIDDQSNNNSIMQQSSLNQIGKDNRINNQDDQELGVVLRERGHSKEIKRYSKISVGTSIASRDSISDNVEYSTRGFSINNKINELKKQMIGQGSDVEENKVYSSEKRSKTEGGGDEEINEGNINRQSRLSWRINGQDTHRDINNQGNSDGGRYIDSKKEFTNNYQQKSNDIQPKVPSFVQNFFNQKNKIVKQEQQIAIENQMLVQRKNYSICSTPKYQVNKPGRKQSEILLKKTFDETIFSLQGNHRRDSQTSQNGNLSLQIVNNNRQNMINDSEYGDFEGRNIQLGTSRGKKLEEQLQRGYLNIENKNESGQISARKERVRPKSSSSGVFKHVFQQSEPCKIVSGQVYHVYKCGDKNDGKCQCSINHLNMLPLKFRTELIDRNQIALKRNNFSFRNTNNKMLFH